MKSTALLIPTYKRFDDLVNTLDKTNLSGNAKFVIVANLEDEELAFLQEKYSDKAIVTDERKFGKLGGCKAYNLAYKIAKEKGFDYAILFADDIIPFKDNWLTSLDKMFIEKDENFGIFSTDECHEGHYGWNIITDAPIAHFFVIKCSLMDELFSEKYIQYNIDFEISLRLMAHGIDICLLPIRLNHLRSGLHREFMDNNMSADTETLLMDYPKYRKPYEEHTDLFLLKETNHTVYLSQLRREKLVPWSALHPKKNLLQVLKNKVKSKLSRTLQKKAI